MPRFRDEWLIDRVMFDYVAGGSCACCGLTHSLFLPDGTADFIRAVSDLETDQAQREISVLEHRSNPWPKELRDQVWADRVRIRQHLKKDLHTYREFWKSHGTSLQVWMRQSPATVQRLLQLSRGEVSHVLNERYNIHSAYGVVLCAAMEQVAHFDLTQYEPDAGFGADAEAERNFEAAMVFDRRRGFTLRGLCDKDSSEREDDAMLDVWCRRMASLGGPKLLHKRSSRAQADEQEPDFEPDDGGEPSAGPSFQSDRRIVRLVIARYWADLLMKTYLETLETSG